jgi:hypothetical protein
MLNALETNTEYIEVLLVIELDFLAKNLQICD